MRIERRFWMGIFLLLFWGQLKSETIFLNDKAISYELVIITNESLKPAFTQFFNLKWSMGIPTEIVTVEWVYRNFSGFDRQEKIRNFIRYARGNLNAHFILIGGDVGIVPTRTLYVPMNGTDDDFIPGDFYYMCLDGNFNADRDTLFGEPGDEVDYTPDVAVARLPVNKATDVENYLGKEIRYLFHPGDYLNRVILIGSDITTPGSGAQFCSEVEDSFPSRFEKIEFFEDNGTNNDKDEVIDSLNRGAGFVYGNLHAQSFDRMLLNFSPRRPLTNFDVDHRLTNVDFPGFYDIVTCHIGGFDVDALAEHLIRDSAGAIGVFATTRLNYPVITIKLNKYFYSLLFHRGIKKIGDLDKMVRSHFASDASNYITYRYVDYSYEMFGDPTLKLWTGNPDSFFVTSPDTITTSTRVLHIEVSDSLGAPIVGAKVVAYLPGIFMSTDSTDSRGEVNLSVFPTHPGSLSLYVEKDGFKNFLKSVAIKSGGNSLSIISKTFIPTQIEPGDTVSLGMQAVNTGTNSLSSLNFRVDARDSFITFLDSTEFITNLARGDTIDLNNAFKFVVERQATDGSRIEITITGLLPSSDTLVVDTAGFTVMGSVIHPLFVSDSTRGDTILLNFGLENQGSGSDWAVLSLDSGRYRILGGADTLILNPVSVEESGYIFRILPDADFDSVINFSLIWSAGDYHYQFKLGNALGIDSVVSKPVDDGVILSWRPVPGAALYAIYQDNPLELVGISSIASWIVQTDSAAIFRIAVVDSNGYRGELSVPVTAYPHLPIKDGWPVYIEGGTYTSPIVCDFDPSYPGKEVFIASFPYGYIYLYHADGTIANGWPIFLDGEIWSSPAAADLDGDSIPEIVVALRSRNEVYAFKSDGSILDGWPVHTYRGTYYTPAIGDIDGDGSPEIVVNDQSANLYVFRADGSGFEDSSGVFLNVSNWWYAGSPVLFDYNGDGRLDIGIGSRVNGYQEFIVVSAGHDTLLEIPVSGRMVSAPVIGEFLLDSTGDEILINDNNELKLYSHNGNLLPGWLVEGFSSAVAADVNYDGQLEIIGTTQSGVAIYNSSGELMMSENFADLDYYLKSPVIADVDNDRTPEVLFESFIGAKLYSVNLDGGITHGFPFNLKESPGYSVPFIEDVDGDGFLDIIVGSTFDSLWVLATPTPADGSRALWKTEKYDIARTGWIRFIPVTAHESGEWRNLRLTPSITRGYLLFDPPRNLGGRFKIEFYDISGRRVAKFQFSRPHPVKLELPSKLPNGIYFYRIRASSQTAEGKILLLR